MGANFHDYRGLLSQNRNCEEVNQSHEVEIDDVCMLLACYYSGCQ